VDDTLVIAAVAVMIMLVIGAYSAFIITRQQRTIDRLTDKLMARDYGEYRRNALPLMREEPRTRKPQSWHDDPSVEVEDDSN
jgi:hypothetical protein